MSALDDILKTCGIICMTTVTAVTAVCGIKGYKFLDNLNDASKNMSQVTNNLKNTFDKDTFKDLSGFLKDLGTFLNSRESIEKLSKEDRENMSYTAYQVVSVLQQSLNEIQGREGGEPLARKICELIDKFKTLCGSVVDENGNLNIECEGGYLGKFLSRVCGGKNNATENTPTNTTNNAG